MFEFDDEQTCFLLYEQTYLETRPAETHLELAEYQAFLTRGVEDGRTLYREDFYPLPLPSC